MNYEVYISDALIEMLQVLPEDFPGTYLGHNSLCLYHTYVLTDKDVEMAKRLIKKNTGVDSVEFDGEVFIARQANECN